MATQGITLPPTPLYETLAARLLNRFKQTDYERVRITEEPIDWIKRVNPKGCSLIVGSKQITDTTNRVKYLYQWPFTFGELAAEYLHYCLEDSPKKAFGGSQGPKAPVAFRGPTKGNFAYVDIKSCYFSLYRFLNLNTEYHFDYFEIGTVPFLQTDELELSKTLRNTVFGLLRKSSRTRFKDGKYNRTNERSDFYRPMICDYVLSTIQAVAQEAWSLFPVQQWLTDAAILPTTAAHELIQYLEEEWQLTATIESHGPAYSFAAGAYKIGSKVTANLMNIPFASDSLTTFESVPIEFLKELRKEVVSIGKDND